jgi:hypothetical protein
MVLRGFDFLLMGFLAGERPATADDANADHGMDGLFNGYRLGPPASHDPASATALDSPSVRRASLGGDTVNP